MTSKKLQSSSVKSAQLIPGKLYRTNDNFTIWPLVDPTVPWKKQAARHSYDVLDMNSLILFVEGFSLPLGGPWKLAPGAWVYRIIIPTGHVRDLVVGMNPEKVVNSYYFSEAK